MTTPTPAAIGGDLFSLGSHPPVADLRDAFRARASVSMSGFLTPDAAQALAGELEDSESWLEIFRGEEGGAYEMPHAEFLALAEDRKQTLTRMIHSAARKGLQYRYRAIRTSDSAADRAQAGRLLDGFVSFLNSPASLALLRRITGMDAIAFADGQATDYRAGDFLTSHDDAVEGKNRLAAYVYSLTPDWRADWGGLLLLENGLEVEGFVPAFNELRIFSVPVFHHVSVVAPWVEQRRLSVTGWLRSRGD